VGAFFGTGLPVLRLTRANLILRLKCVQVFLWDGPLAGQAVPDLLVWPTALLNGPVKPFAFMTALCVSLIWAVTGPIFHYRTTWKLIMKTGTIIILNRASCSEYAEPRYSGLHLKVSELIVALKPADASLAATHWHDRENQIRQNYCN
jgi:hypothetical protein